MLYPIIVWLAVDIYNQPALGITIFFSWFLYILFLMWCIGHLSLLKPQSKVAYVNANW
jgi:hypothetical protein